MNINFTLLLIFILTPPLFAGSSKSDQFICGHYRIKGKLRLQKNGITLLGVYPETTREFWIVVKGLKARDSLTYDETHVVIEGNILKAGPGSQTKLTVTGKLKTIAQSLTVQNPVELIKSCSGS